MQASAEYRLAWRKDQHFGIKRTVDATGTQRRLQALARRGWSFAELARRCGLTRNAFLHIVNGRNLYVRRFVAERVQQLLCELGNVNPPDAPATRRRIAEAKRRAWAPALAWDNIDDPGDVPRGVPYLAQYGYLEDLEHPQAA